MIKKIIYITFFFACFFSCSILNINNSLISSDINLAENYLKYINQKELKENLSVLASDDFEGRETTKQGQKKAARYIKEYFISNNIQGGNNGEYFQHFNVSVTDFTSVYFTLNNQKLKLVDHFYLLGGTKDSIYNNKKVIFVDYGITNNERDDYANLNVSGFFVLLKEGIPNDQNISLEWNNWRKKVINAMNHGAIGVITIKQNYDKSVEAIKKYLLKPEMKIHHDVSIKKDFIPNIYISKNVFSSFFNLNEINTLSLNIDIEKQALSENVVGFIEGTEKKSEILVISAHYDHIGYDNGEVCNGADDDGSGTVSLMSISKAFQMAKDAGFPPKRSILFIAFSGEEKGLFGSSFYTDHPLYPLSSTFANLNIDMVGRVDTIYDNNNYIYLIGSDRISKDLHKINESINNKYIHYVLDYKYNDLNDPNHFYYRSDHYNFAKNGIPVIFYFSGIHRDYHKPTDDIEKIDFLKLEKTAKYIFLTSWELVNRKKSI